MRICSIGIVTTLSTLLYPGLVVSDEVLRYLGPDAATGTSRAVVVNDQPLAHTAQLLPLDRAGKLVGADDAGQQAERVLANLDAALAAGGSLLNRAVKLNVYVSSPEAVPAVQKQLAKRFAKLSPPAVSFVVTPLPLQEKAMVAIDAVAATTGDAGDNLAREVADGVYPLAKEAAHVAVLPRGDAVYIAGQAEPGETLGAAALATLQGLGRTLEYLKLDRSHTVSLKCFLNPMSEVQQVEAALAEFFAGQTIPPVSYVEWTAKGIEIELIAAAPATELSGEKTDTASYITPPWFKPAPTYCKVVRVHGRRIIYTSGLYAEEAGNGDSQVRSLLAQLDAILKQAGGGMEHLAKATYYVTDDDASLKLNEIRPEFYPAARPPSASKASVKHVGFPDRTVTMDLIGVISD